MIIKIKIFWHLLRAAIKWSFFLLPKICKRWPTHLIVCWLSEQSCNIYLSIESSTTRYQTLFQVQRYDNSHKNWRHSLLARNQDYYAEIIDFITCIFLQCINIAKHNKYIASKICRINIDNVTINNVIFYYNNNI